MASNYWEWAGKTNVTQCGGVDAEWRSIANNLETSMRAVGGTATNISFWWKVSCQTNDDFLGFFINGTLARQISGEVDWRSNYFSLPAGTNFLTWQYQTTNHFNMPQGSNSAWVDQIRFSPTNPPPPAVVYSFTALILDEGPPCLASS